MDIEKTKKEIGNDCGQSLIYVIDRIPPLKWTHYYFDFCTDYGFDYDFYRELENLFGIDTYLGFSVMGDGIRFPIFEEIRENGFTEN